MPGLTVKDARSKLQELATAAVYAEDKAFTRWVSERCVPTPQTEDGRPVP